MLRISADLGLFRSLAEGGVSLTVTQIAELTRASPPFLGNDICDARIYLES
jgi:demethylsterigmatocystin 6-O-methyltransferase